MVTVRQVRQLEKADADSNRGSTEAATNGTAANGAAADRAAANGAAERTKAAETRKEESEDDGAWPASLRRYLQRAFDKCDKKPGSRQHALLEKALHRKVTDAMADNAMLTKDWDNEPLPRCALNTVRDTTSQTTMKCACLAKSTVQASR